jgi:hypothetical protein
MSKATVDVLIISIHSSQSFWLIRTTAVVFLTIINKCIDLDVNAYRVADTARAYNCYRNAKKNKCGEINNFNYLSSI